jgi:RimJ/RimL family protein N-acetyltransferase
MTLPSLRTARLFLDPWTEHEVDAVHALLVDPGMRRFLLDDVVISREQAAAFIATHLALAERLGMGTWALRLEPTGPMIGFCGVREIERRSDVELMYGLLPSAWGQGLATEAARAVVQHLWRVTDIARIFGRADPPNATSFAVMRRIGMRPHAVPGPLVSYVLHRPPG